MIIHDKQSNTYYEDEIVFIEAFGKRIKYLFDCGSLYSCKIVNGKLVDDKPLTQEDMDVMLATQKQEEFDNNKPMLGELKLEADED